MINSYDYALGLIKWFFFSSADDPSGVLLASWGSLIELLMLI